MTREDLAFNYGVLEMYPTSSPFDRGGGDNTNIGRTIKLSIMNNPNCYYKCVPNNSKRTFTVYCQENGKTYAKYRTFRLSKEEFQSCLHHTQNDWRNWMRYGDYDKIY